MLTTLCYMCVHTPPPSPPLTPPPPPPPPVVYHHGKAATGGHYTSDVFHPACGGWVRLDDGLLKAVPEEFVLRPASQGSNKVAYLLFYRRLDTVSRT